MWYLLVVSAGDGETNQSATNLISSVTFFLIRDHYGIIATSFENTTRAIGSIDSSIIITATKQQRQNQMNQTTNSRRSD
jgi:hypothetical protein